MSGGTLLANARPTAAGVRRLRAVLYLRISDDKGGQGLGVERQKEDGLALIERNGWELVGVFTDNDISAFSGKPRPDYLAMVEAVRAGLVDVVVAWHPDRLHRSPRELEDWIDLLDATGTTVATVTAGDYDLGSIRGRQAARMFGAMATGESEHKRERVTRAMEQNAKLGKWHGPLRTFGYRVTRVGNGHTFETMPDEAAVIVEAVDRALAGESLVNLAREFAQRGVRGTKGAVITHQALRKIILSARIAGWREHTPGRTASEPGWVPAGEFVARGEWEAIVDRSKVERLRRVFGDESRRHGPNGRSYLLSGGIAVCGECGYNLCGKPDRDKRTYKCVVRENGKGGCGRVSIGADDLEAYVRAEVRNAHKSGRFARALAAAEDDGTEAARALVDELVAEGDALAARAGRGELTASQFDVWNAPLAARLADARADLALRQEREGTALLAGGVEAFDEAWREAAEDGNLDALRARLRAALIEVRVARRTALPSGSNAFDRTRLDPQWRY